MELSIYISRTIGVIYLSVGIGLFIFRESYVLAFRKILDSPGYALLGGFMAVAIGMAMITYHNLWVNDWRTAITVIGWIALFKGILLLITPTYVNIFRGLLMVRKGKGLTIAIMFVGILFCYLGFFQ